MIPGVRGRGVAVRDPLDDFLQSRGVPVFDRQAASAELSGYGAAARRSAPARGETVAPTEIRPTS